MATGLPEPVETALRAASPSILLKLEIITDEREAVASRLAAARQKLRLLRTIRAALRA